MRIEREEYVYISFINLTLENDFTIKRAGIVFGASLSLHLGILLIDNSYKSPLLTAVCCCCIASLKIK